jgi:hypothetical protein
MVADVVVTVRAADHEADVMVVWEGGATTSFVLAMSRSGQHSHATDEATVDLVRRLASRYDDNTIAQVLSKQGRTTGRGLPFTQRRVAHVRLTRGIPAYEPPPVTVTPGGEDVTVVSLAAAASLLGVSAPTVYRWLADGFVTGEQLTPGGPWHIRVTDEMRERVAPDVPEGWLGLDGAAKALGVSRQTVLDRVKRGQLRAVYVNRGRRGGLAIEVPAQAGPDLFVLAAP